MTLDIRYTENRMLAELSAALSPSARQKLHSVAAERVADMVQRHIRAYAFSKHGTAQRLGGDQTGHYEKGAAAISTSATDEAGTVTIPIPGIQRAWHDLTIVPKSAKVLTIPLAGIAYGRRASEMKAIGFRLWCMRTKKGGSVLMGERDGDEPTALYFLTNIVEQKKDPSLLPSVQEISDAGANAMIGHIRAVVRKARRRAQ